MDEISATEYITRRLTPVDALQIPELANVVNGPGYIHAEVYHPQKLLQLNKDGHLVSVVAIHREHGVVGHSALERPDLGPIAETGEAMVLPDHRHHHLLDRMKVALEEEARKLGLAGIYGNAVTHHVFSQRTEERYKGRPTSFLLGASPANAHRIEGSTPQRVSLLSYFTFLCEPGATIAHLPERHQPIVEQIYKLLGRSVEFGIAKTPAGPGTIESSYDPPTQQGQLKVAEPGSDAAEKIDSARRGLMNNFGAEVIYLELPLHHPGSAEICAQAEALGFFFSGISPQPPGSGDLLRLQYLKTPLDLTLLQIESEFARAMLSYIARERERVRRA
jgi:hypothetical protein